MLTAEETPSGFHGKGVVRTLQLPLLLQQGCSDPVSVSFPWQHQVAGLGHMAFAANLQGQGLFVPHSGTQWEFPLK